MTQIENPRRRRVSVYDLATDEKQAWGARLREARELAGMTLSDAAEALGYSQPVQLSLMENGHRLPPTLVIQESARLYGTTADYLCGLATDSDRDPAAALHREAAAQVAGEVRRALAGATAAAAAAVRAGAAARRSNPALARAVVVASLTFERVRRANPGFDDLRGGATLARQLDELARSAQLEIDALTQANRREQLRDARDLEDQPEAGDLDVQRALQPFPRLEQQHFADTGSHDEEDQHVSASSA